MNPTVALFQTRVKRTFNYKDRDLDLLHCAIGLQTEIGELHESAQDLTNKKEEIGDALWYLGAFGNWIEKECPYLFNQFIIPLPGLERDYKIESELLYQLVIESSKFSDYAKRAVFYSKDPSDWKFVLHLTNKIWQLTDLYCKVYGFTIEDALNANFAKLSLRYPEKFTEELAINRDLDAEREALEKGTDV